MYCAATDMRLKAICSANVINNGISKILLTIVSQPNSQDEHVLLNLLKSRGGFDEGDEVEVTFRVTRKAGQSHHD